MTSNNWKLELNRMLDSFANQAESSLDIINREFKTMSRSFDENFRQYFLKMSNLRLDSSYTKIALNHWDECQIQGIENRIHSTHGNQTQSTAPAASTGTSMLHKNTKHRMDNSNPGAENGSRPLLVVKNENQNDLIGVVDSEDERDFEQFNRDETNTHNKEIVDENGSNASMQGDNDDDGTGDVEIAIKNEPEASVKCEVEDSPLPMVTFDPNRNSDETDTKRGEVVPTLQKCQNRKSRPPQLNIQTQNKVNGKTSKHFKCKLCDYVTNRRGDLKRHQKVHVNERIFGVARDDNNLYRCTHCDRQFIRLNDLSVHMKSHKDGRPLYDCTRCMRQFVQKSRKDRHEIRCEGRQYECHLCKVYVTTNKSSMQNHMRTHSGAKPFSCMECDKFFTQKIHLRRHLNNVHNRTKA